MKYSNPKLFIAALFFLSMNLLSQDMGMVSDHYDEDQGTFFNPYVNETNHPGFSQMLKWFWERESPEISDSIVNAVVPRVNPSTNRIFAVSPDSGIQITWIGHSTFLVQIDGINFLTDLIFTERSSPIQWFGPKRFRAPVSPLDSLPPIDFVVLSHDHYDHLDLTTAHKLDNGPKWIVPLRVKTLLISEGITNVEEFDWWEDSSFGPLKIICTPVQHFSGRTPFSHNESLWAGWAIIGTKQKVWFAGDTGYNEIQFKAIGNLLGPFDLALIPIGAYDPEWIMQSHHVNPEEAVLIHNDIRSRVSVGMHWGTFTLTDEPIGEPSQRLMEAVESAGLEANSFMNIPQGETLTIR